MQILEATVSLMVLISFLSFVASDFHAKKLDDSLYRYQLVNDVWRTLYLRGDFTDFSFDSGNLARGRTEQDLKHIGEMTGFCIFIGGERITNCRGESVEEIVSTERIAMVDGELEMVAVSLAAKNTN